MLKRHQPQPEQLEQSNRRDLRPFTPALPPLNRAFSFSSTSDILDNLPGTAFSPGLQAGNLPGSQASEDRVFGNIRNWEVIPPTEYTALSELNEAPGSQPARSPSGVVAYDPIQKMQEILNDPEIRLYSMHLPNHPGRIGIKLVASTVEQLNKFALAMSHLEINDPYDGDMELLRPRELICEPLGYALPVYVRHPMRDRRVAKELDILYAAGIDLNQKWRDQGRGRSLQAIASIESMAAANRAECCTML